MLTFTATRGKCFQSGQCNLKWGFPS